MSLLAFFNTASTAPEAESTLTAPYNAATFLDLPRVYRDEPAGTHPDVYDFGPGKKWNGYRYWMAWTPFNNADTSLENPSVAAANSPEGPWVTPAGLTNPIFPFQGAGWNADTEIVYDKVGDRIGVLWRSNALILPDGTLDKGGEWWSLKWSSNGVDWSERLDAFPPYRQNSSPFMSPSLVEDADGTWKMWYHYGVAMRTAPSVTGPWSEPIRCTVTGAPANSLIWHGNTIRHRGQYRALWQVKVPVPATSTDSEYSVLIPAVSENGTQWRAGAPVLDALSPWEGSTRRGLYRSAFLPADNGADYDVWYAVTGSGWRIAHTRIPQRHWSELG